MEASRQLVQAAIALERGWSRSCKNETSTHKQSVQHGVLGAGATRRAEHDRSARNAQGKPISHLILREMSSEYRHTGYSLESETRHSVFEVQRQLQRARRAIPQGQHTRARAGQWGKSFLRSSSASHADIKLLSLHATSRRLPRPKERDLRMRPRRRMCVAFRTPRMRCLSPADTGYNPGFGHSG